MVVGQIYKEKALWNHGYLCLQKKKYIKPMKTCVKASYVLTASYVFQFWKNYDNYSPPIIAF